MKKVLFMILWLCGRAQAFEVGSLTISGTGCEKQDVSVVRPTRETEYKFPFALVMSKHADSQLERKACQLSLPVKLGKKEKLQIANVLQNVTVKAFGGAHAQVSLSVFGVGAAALKPLVVEVKTPTALEQELKSDGVVFESQCGKDAIVRANLNAFVQGPGTASISTGDLQLTLKAVACKR